MSEIHGVERRVWEKWGSYSWGRYDGYQDNSRENEFRATDQDEYERGLLQGSLDLSEESLAEISEEQIMRDHAMSAYCSEVDEARNPTKYN